MKIRVAHVVAHSTVEHPKAAICEREVYRLSHQVRQRLRGVLGGVGLWLEGYTLVVERTETQQIWPSLEKDVDWHSQHCCHYLHVLLMLLAQRIRNRLCHLPHRQVSIFGLESFEVDGVLEEEGGALGEDTCAAFEEAFACGHDPVFGVVIGEGVEEFEDHGPISDEPSAKELDSTTRLVLTSFGLWQSSPCCEVQHTNSHMRDIARSLLFDCV